MFFLNLFSLQSYCFVSERGKYSEFLTLGRKKNTDFVCHLGKNSYFCTVFLMIHYYKKKNQSKSFRKNQINE